MRAEEVLSKTYPSVAINLTSGRNRVWLVPLEGIRRKGSEDEGFNHAVTGRDWAGVALMFAAALALHFLPHGGERGF